MELKDQFYVAKKAKKVIESCNSIDQLNSAKNYVNLFFNSFTTPDTSIFSFNGTVKADQSTVKLYNNLMEIWVKKNNELSM
jgi:hypothetical protein